MPPHPPELAVLRSEIAKHRTPLYRGLWPLLDALDGFAVATARELAALRERIAGLMPPGEFIEADSPLGRQAADELARRKSP